MDGEQITVPLITMPQVAQSIWLAKQYLGQKEPDKKDETTVVITPESIEAYNQSIEKNNKVLKRAARIQREELSD